MRGDQFRGFFILQQPSLLRASSGAEYDPVQVLSRGANSRSANERSPLPGRLHRASPGLGSARTKFQAA